MASSSSPPNQRRRPLRKRQPLARHNSSFFGAIKNLVATPLSWFTNTDEFDDSKDLQGKRRRLAIAPAEPGVSGDDRISRNKRMRVHSPPLDESLTSASNGYLDPPSSMFQQHQQQPSGPLIQPFITRSPSVTKSYDFPSNNSNLPRGSTPLRTMSVDPPARSLSRTYGMTSIDPPAHPLARTYAMASIPGHGDVSIGSRKPVTGVTRDMSMPPLSNRTSFPLHTSLTPQPLPRETSEPPPITSLSSNPTFIRPPKKVPQSGLSRQSSVTLGTLAESVRSTRSPARQHSSLLFGPSDERPSHSSHIESPVEKALHEMDIYKTPLVPTRLRSTNIPLSTSSSDLFKSRRTSPLVLMQDDKRTHRLGRTNSGVKDAPVVNDTKPYAGEGGMKKLLARRKQEVESEEKMVASEDLMDDSEKAIDKADSTVPPLPPLPKADVFAASTEVSIPKSSLRVGRTKARGHITRPTRPTKAKFSAAFDEDGMEDIDELDEEMDIKRKEREALDEAAKRMPVFQVPEGFSFAKENNPIKIDSSDAKEPPIQALPFSLAKSMATPTELSVQQVNTMQSLIKGPVTAETGRKEANDTTTKPAEANLTVSASTTPNGIPNFFASSSILTKPIELPKTASFVFGMPSTSQPSFSVPTKDAENPLWIDESRKLDGSKLMPSLPPLSGPTATTSNETTSNTGQPNFTPVPMPAPQQTIGAHASQEGVPRASASLKTAETPVSLGIESSGGTPSVIASSSTQLGPLWGASKPPGPFGDQPKASPVQDPSYSIDSSKSGEPFSESSKLATSAPTSAPFSFAAPASTTESSKAPFEIASTRSEQTKSPFGSGGFSFANVDSSKAAEQKSTSFSFLSGNSDTSKDAKQEPSNPPPVFGNAKQEFSKPPFVFGGPSVNTSTEQKTLFAPKAIATTSVTEAPKTAPFSFGPVTPAATSTAPTSISFSFSGDGSNASDNSNKSFVFGQTAPMPTAERPSTPPRSQYQEVTMEESPTRDMQVNKPLEKSTLGTGFSFGLSASGSTPAAQSSESLAPFSFGSSSTSANPFAKDHKLAENKPFGGFVQTTASSATFTFGQSTPSDNQSNPSGSFSFGNSPISNTGTQPTFAFGGPRNSSSSVFGQPQPGSTPTSPSNFNQSSPAPFAFGAPLPPVNTSFTFGSQPASPAGGSSTSLPPPATPGGFGSFSGNTLGQQPTSPFSASAGAPPTLFTIGSAPAQTLPTGARQIRKLPNRRGGIKR